MLSLTLILFILTCYSCSFSILHIDVISHVHNFAIEKDFTNSHFLCRREPGPLYENVLETNRGGGPAADSDSLYYDRRSDRYGNGQRRFLCSGYLLPR